MNSAYECTIDVIKRFNQATHNQIVLHFGLTLLIERKLYLRLKPFP